MADAFPPHPEVVIARTGPAASLRLRDGVAPAPGEGEVTIDVAFSGLNFADIQMRIGMYPDAPKRPFVPGYEVSGVVRAIGAGVAHVKVGDRVMAGTYFGGYAARVTIPARQCFVVPAGMELSDAAALPVAFFTAQMALGEMARVRAGDRVLIDCATGGVGTIAIQLARKAGAEVVGLTTSPAKKPYIEALGARALTAAELAAEPATRFDVVLNSGGGKSIEAHRALLDLGGRIVCFGVQSGVTDGRRDLLQVAKTLWQMPKISVLKLFNQSTGLFALNALTVMKDPAWVERLTRKMTLITELGLRPHVGKVFQGVDVADAHRFLETRQATGKVLLAWPAA